LRHGRSLAVQTSKKKGLIIHN